MSRFYVQIKGGSHVGAAEVGRMAHAGKGAYAIAASYKGAVRVVPYVDDQNRDCMRITREPWRNSDNLTQVIFDGPIDADHWHANNLVGA